MEEKPFPNYHTIRCREPGDFIPTSFKTITLGKGVLAVIGKIKGESSMTVQALRFDKDVFSFDEAKKWCRSHEFPIIESTAATGEVKETDKPMESNEDVCKRLGITVLAKSIEEYELEQKKIKEGRIWK